jgi:hypothetical protein
MNEQVSLPQQNSTIHIKIQSLKKKKRIPENKSHVQHNKYMLTKNITENRGI